MEGIFTKSPLPPLWKFQLSFVHFSDYFGLLEPCTTQEISIPSVGRVSKVSATAHCKMGRKYRIEDVDLSY